MSPGFLFLCTLTFCILSLNRTHDSHSLILDMLERKLFRAFHVALSDRLCQFLMFLHQNISCFTFFQIFYTISVDLLAKIIQNLHQSFIISSFINYLMEINIRLSHLYQVAFRRTGLENLSRLLQLPDIRICHGSENERAWLIHRISGAWQFAMPFLLP